LRVLLNASDITTAASKPNSSTTPLVILTTDALYLGWHERFASRFFQFSTLNTNPTSITVQYWDGSAYSAVEDVIDQTLGFTANGFLSWVNKSNWTKHDQDPLVDEQLYWIKITVSADLSAGTVLSAIMNLICDDDIVRSLYPEVISDSRYLPPGRTNFLDQYLLAKDLVVTRLIQKKVINDESQIIDINQVSIAAAHAAVMAILTPIARSDEAILILNRARDNFESLLTEVNFAIDEDMDGKISETERSQITSGNITMRGS
jgi:hypothetical protein